MSLRRKIAWPGSAPPRWFGRAVVVSFAALALALAQGCAHPPRPPIQPWQREHLSKRAMRFDADPLESRFRQHMFGSREGAEGGYGQPGGGCGCN